MARGPDMRKSKPLEVVGEGRTQSDLKPIQGTESKSVVAQWCLTLCDPMDCSPPGSSVYMISQQEYWSGLPFPSPGDLPDSGMDP